ncbi:putative H/ACA ribonucleoprotein complex subunit 1 [Forsythia ovata]|uniref:H/ACA ribonucleoprotein complex subunit 1 n=1 Tax=Forsythia ovata TaxID=205694 RepID=A0ABD1P717_9LAMI
MEISVISDTITTIAYSTQGLGFSNFLLNRHHHVLSLSDTSSDQSPPVPPPPSAGSTLQISAVAPPPTKTLPKRIVRKSRRTKRKSLTGDNNIGEENEFLIFIDGGGFININDGGYFGSGGSGGGGNGGKGWNFNGHGGANWGESSNNSFYDPAFDFVYEVLSWIALSNCLHFAFKKVVRIVGRG